MWRLPSGFRLTSANHPGAHLARCGIFHLSEPRLVDVARIFIDADERLEQPVISHGVSLTKIHYVAFDAHLIGVDPDYRIHVSDRLLETHNGPFLRTQAQGPER
jgi:putative restriction endonuclease